LGVSESSALVEKTRASPPHGPLEDGLNHPADASRSNLADALNLLSRCRLSKPQELILGIVRSMESEPY
jgi:hypothetical protein